MDHPDNVYWRCNYSELNNYGVLLLAEKKQDCHCRKDKGYILMSRKSIDIEDVRLEVYERDGANYIK